MVKAEELIRQQKEREQRRNITFEKIYEIIDKKISMASMGDFYHAWYQIPEFLVGQSSYNLEECKKYIINKLKKNGFEVELYDGHIILIKWYPK